MLTAAFRIVALTLYLWPVCFGFQAQKKSTPREMFFAGLEMALAEANPTEAKKGTKSTPKSKRPGSTIEVSTVPKTQAGQDNFGLRFSLLKVMGQTSQEVSPMTRFRKGDAIQIKVQPNKDGYLYVVHQGSSGNWDLMHPAPYSEKGSNHINAGKEYLVPQESLLRFDNRPGIEKLFLVVSREPEASLERLIYTVRSWEREGSRGAQPAGKTSGSIGIDNNVITELRNKHTPNLAVEGLDGARASSRADEGVYVVNKGTGQDSRVVVDIRLTHQ